MTASSVELFPCRVQLMGLPRSTSRATSTASGSVNRGSLSIGINSRPSVQKVQRASRNLFGAPDPIEMKNLYQQEAERQRKYVLERYNIDTKSSTDSNEDCKNVFAANEHYNINYRSSSFKQPTAFPTLIEQELKQHDQRRQGTKESLCRTSFEETPSNTKICNHANHIFEVKRRCEYVTTLSPAVDHQKPYNRQSLLTERFNMRKSKVCLSRNNTKCFSVGVTTTNCSETTRNLEIPQLLENNVCNSKHEKDTKSICKKTCVESDKDSISSLVCKDKHTAVSVQQNLS